MLLAAAPLKPQMMNGVNWMLVTKEEKQFVCFFCFEKFLLVEE